MASSPTSRSPRRWSSTSSTAHTTGRSSSGPAAGPADAPVIARGGMVYSRSVRVAGDKMDEAIIQHIKRKYNLLIGERTAELIKMGIGTAYPTEEELTMDIKGRDLVAGVPRTLTVTSSEIREALSETGNGIVEAVTVTLERTPPELAR